MYDFAKVDGLGVTGTITIDGTVRGTGVIERFTPSGFNVVGAGLTCGYELGPAVGDGYDAPFRFTGCIVRAFVEVRGPMVRHPLAEIEVIVSEQ